MKKKLMIVIASILVLSFAGFGIAGLLDNSDDTVSLSKSAKTTLNDKGINAPQTSELSCDGTICMFKMWEVIDGERYNLGTHKVTEQYCSSYFVDEENRTECDEYTDFTIQELKDNKNEIIVNWLEEYAGVIDEREAKATNTKLGSGGITIDEKK